MTLRDTSGRRSGHQHVEHIRGPGELLQAVPYLLGFHPEASLVLVGLARGRVVVTARIDLVDVEQASGHLLERLAGGGAREIIGAVYDDTAMAVDEAAVVELLDRCCIANEVRLLDVVTVSEGRWRSTMCPDPGCCPPEGAPVPSGISSFAAAAAVAGRVALPDRRAMAAQLDPLPEDRRSPLLPEAEAAYVRLADATLGVEGRRHERAAVRRAFTAARASATRDWAGVDDAAAVELGAALALIPIRDAVWMGVDDRRIDGRNLWRALGRSLPSPWDAAPLFLFAWSSWRAGEGALASVAAERAIESDPGYSAADLLLAALSQGLDPRRVPRLRLPRPA